MLLLGSSAPHSCLWALHPRIHRAFIVDCSLALPPPSPQLMEVQVLARNCVQLQRLEQLHRVVTTAQASIRTCPEVL